MNFLRGAILHVRALVVVLTARSLLARSDTTAVLRRMARGPAAPRRTDPYEAMRAVGRMGHAVGATCLPQSVAVASLLERDGHDPVVILGCRRDGGGWSAHAWVENDGLTLEPVIALEHAPLARLSRVDDWVPSPVV